DLDDLLARMRADDRPTGEVPVYVLYTGEMLLKFPAMRALGTSGPATAPKPGSFGIRRLRCDRVVDDVVHCAGATLDLQSGTVERSPSTGRATVEPARLRRAVIVERGRVLREKEFTDAGQLTVEIVLDSGTVSGLYLVDEPAFQSNLNQMFVLGRFDPSRFEE